MAQVLLEKEVLFFGIWRPRNTVDDSFHRTVSRQLQEKQGVRATWRLTSEGLTIVAAQSDKGRAGQTDQIPVHALHEVTVNRYSSLCLMATYLDPSRRFSSLVCRCQSQQDAAHVVQVFRQLRKSQSGEGYRIDLKRPQGINWTLKTKQDGEGAENDGPEGGSLNGNGSFGRREEEEGAGLVVEVEQEDLERESLEVDGRPCFNVGVQTELGPDDDAVSTASDMSYQSLKDELVSLSNEVRDIKILLEQTTGISAEEFFRRRRENGAPHLVPVKRTLSHDSEVTNGEKRVNFASLPSQDKAAAGGNNNDDDDEDFDIRSVGMQTQDSGSKRGKYMKRVRNALTPARYLQASSRSRSGSSNSSLTSPGPVSPMSPYSPANGAVFTYAPHGQRFTDQRRDPRHGSASASLSRMSAVGGGGGGTIMRPIESVYSTHAAGRRQKRRQLIVLPGRSSSVPRHIRRSASESEDPPVQVAMATNGGGTGGENGSGEL